MSLKWGSQNVTDLKWGSTPVNKVMCGSNVVWQRNSGLFFGFDYNSGNLKAFKSENGIEWEIITNGSFGSVVESATLFDGSLYIIKRSSSSGNAYTVVKLENSTQHTITSYTGASYGGTYSGKNFIFSLGGKLAICYAVGVASTHKVVVLNSDGTTFAEGEFSCPTYGPYDFVLASKNAMYISCKDNIKKVILSNDSLSSIVVSGMSSGYTKTNLAYGNGCLSYTELSSATPVSKIIVDDSTTSTISPAGIGKAVFDGTRFIGFRPSFADNGCYVFTKDSTTATLTGSISSDAMVMMAARKGVYVMRDSDTDEMFVSTNLTQTTKISAISLSDNADIRFLENF